MTDPAFTADTRLASYGTLAPGRANHHQLDGLTGTWRAGTVNGTLAMNGWGADFGYPVLTLDPAGPAVEVWVFESPDLPAHWARLDTFEGPGYRRAVATAATPDGDIDVSIYVAAKTV